MIKIIHLNLYYLYALVTHENVCKFINIHGYQTSEKDLQNHITIGQGFYFIYFLYCVFKGMPKVYTNSINFYYLFN